MKRWILSLALLTLGFTASAQNDLIDRGELAPEIAAASGEKMEWLPSFNGVIVEGLFRIRFERVPMDQAPKIVFNTKGVYDSRFTAEVNKNKMLVISERIGTRERSETEVTVYYNNLKEIRISGANATFGEPIDFPQARCWFSNGAVVSAALDVKDLQMDVTGKSVVVLTGKVRYWDLNVSTAQVDAAAVEVMSVRVNSTSKADVTITAPERLEASVGTKGRITCIGEPELLHTSNSLIGGGDHLQIAHSPCRDSCRRSLPIYTTDTGTIFRPFLFCFLPDVRGFSLSTPCPASPNVLCGSPAGRLSTS